MKNELAFANRQAQNNEVSVKGSGGSFHYFSWGGSHTALAERGTEYTACIRAVHTEAPPPGVVSAGTKSYFVMMVVLNPRYNPGLRFFFIWTPLKQGEGGLRHS